MERNILKNGHEISIDCDIENINLAIKKGWESLYFPEVGSFFISAEAEGYQVAITTEGEINISSFDEDHFESYSNRDEDEIRAIIDNGELGKWDVRDNNWFCITYYKKEHGDYQHIDDVVYEDVNKSIYDLTTDLVYELIRFIEEDEDEDEEDEY